MPIFEYACKSCQHEFEALVRSDTTPRCPACDSSALDKRLSMFATAAQPEAASPMGLGPCGTCGHPDGPGACSVH